MNLSLLEELITNQILTYFGGPGSGPRPGDGSGGHAHKITQAHVQSAHDQLDDRQDSNTQGSGMEIYMRDRMNGSSHSDALNHAIQATREIPKGYIKSARTGKIIPADVSKR